MTAPALPDGATTATDFDDSLGHRVIFGEQHTSGGGVVQASASQTRRGAIVDDPLEEGPRVHVTLADHGALTYGQARQLAQHLHQAANLAEAWAIEAAKQRHPAGSALATDGDDRWADPAWAVDSARRSCCAGIGGHTPQCPATGQGGR